MVLGLRTKNRKRGSVQVDYLVHLQEIRPWPPSEPLSSVQSVLLQWENGDQSSGSLASVVGDGKVEFNESFRLPVTLYGEASKKGTAGDSFQKNYLELYFYETGTNKPAKGQLMGSAVINLADYGIINESMAISAPINFKKSSKSTAQPILYFIIEPFYKNSSSSSSKSSLLKEVYSDKNGSESFSQLMNEGNDEECEIASFTDDDDVSSLSSRTISSSAFETRGGSPAQNCKNGSDSVKDGTQRVHRDSSLLSNLASAKDKDVNVCASSLSSTNSYSEVSSDMYIEVGINTDQERWLEDSQTNLEDDRITRRREKNGTEVARTSNLYVGLSKDTEKKEQHDNEQGNLIFESRKNSIEDKLVSKLPEVATKREIKLRSNTLANSRTSLGSQSGTVMNDKIKHVKSQLHFDSAKSNGLVNSNQFTGKERKNSIAKDVYKGSTREETTKGFSDSKVELKSKIEMLEEELREAAALEVGLYSVVAEHGSSTNKVHAPARRLSRFYFHACKAMSKTKRASAARTVIQGLVLVSKACGNDVPRLNFWLSNSVLLRAIVTVVARKQISGGLRTNSNGDQRGLEERYASKRLESSPNGNKKNNTGDSSDDWEDPQTFIVALEKLEAWIFSRIIESVWWQTLTPHMQSAAAKGSTSKKASGRRYGFGNQEQGNFSIELWKKAFKDACERLCPVRAGGHDCGCLPVLARLVMEQLVGRLDVAMFNAILRESAEEMPTDPVSDPISDSKVLPIPAGKSSFGAGAQLKNAIGSWSRWLSDLFGIDDNDSLEDMNEACDDKSVKRETFKPFPLLNALSDLMMLPFHMLADSSTRKEVCPTFGTPLIERVLNNFVPDEFNPEPIPKAVFESLDSEGLHDSEEESITSFPCTAAPTVYSPPPAASLSGIVGKIDNQTLQRTGSTVLRKSYTSDDELDELDSSITSIITDSSHTSPISSAPNWMPKGKGGRKVVRYQLLREVWRDGGW